MRLATVFVLASSVASAAPKHCDVGVHLASPADLKVQGKVTSLKRTKGEFPHYEVAVAGKAFDLYADTAPFQVGSTIDVDIRRGGGFQIVYDGLIKDAAGKTLLVASASGSTALADGWTVQMGAVIESHQDPNQKQQSVDRTMALEFSRGTAKVTAKPNACVEVKDGDTTWLVTGFGHSWIGIRPPEGVDYQMFSIVRKP